MATWIVEKDMVIESCPFCEGKMEIKEQPDLQMVRLAHKCRMVSYEEWIPMTRARCIGRTWNTMISKARKNLLESAPITRLHLEQLEKKVGP